MYRIFFKRLFDLILALLALPFWLLILILIGPVIYFEDKGPIFYNAPRLGKGGKIFKMYKFRSMKLNAPDIRNYDGSTFNAANDPRLTKMGKFIRSTSLDETPQILNVIKGNMSFIGPRPDLPEHIHYYRDDNIRKLEVLPGISGYNQAYYRNTAEWKDRLRNDIYYVNNISLWLDIKILFKTVESTIFKKGIYTTSKLKNSKGEY